MAPKVGQTVDVVEPGKGRRPGEVTRVFGPAGNESVDVVFKGKGEVAFEPPAPEADNTLPDTGIGQPRDVGIEGGVDLGRKVEDDRRSVKEVLRTAKWETLEAVPHINANKTFHWLEIDA